ncbi:trypsin-like serine peptidase [Streptomyces sp. NBC_00829]|uniref:trypsin-like serine peptidase n=1 Tax=Streptomyces sp. NBC_00829 TaxID=2903679 RepID=UPI00386B22A3|nr:trypsin-like peptidase domain-containing protein [Streptomyces sp. NBC_00829]
MAEAVPVDAQRGEGPLVRASGRSKRAASSSGVKQGEYFGGLPMVGTFFYKGRELGGKLTYCTGSVVHSRTRDLVLTAGHCAVSLKVANNRIFVPQYRHGDGADKQPSGVFPVHDDGDVFIDPRYKKNTKLPVSDLDVAFVRVGANSKGKAAEDATGALTFTPTAGYSHQVTVVGYPSSQEHNKDHKAFRCETSTRRLPGFRQMRMECGGFYGGVSGGPWITDYDAGSRKGR